MYRVLKALKEFQHESFIMATVIGLQGSAYRHEGAKVLIGQNGTVHGMISAGCLEQDLMFHASEIFHEGTPKLLSYDLRTEDDLEWGRGAGCNGIIDVYLEPIKWNSTLSQVDQWLREGEQVVSFIDIRENTRSFWQEKEIGRQSLIPIVDSFLKTSSNIQRNGDLWLERFSPREVLYVFGAGHDAEPLVHLASLLDFDVRIVDPREQRCNKTHFPTADQWIVEHPNQFIHHHNIPETSYLVIMTHSFQWDRELLLHFIDVPHRYLGVVGTRARTARLLNQSQVPESICSPIGLRINAEGPEEVSISIIAEILNKRK